MNTYGLPVRSACAACACVVLATLGRAQISAAPAPSTPPAEVITLNPFEVQADSDTSYGALNSNSITAFNTALDKLPISADMFDQAFIQDTASTSVETMIEAYSAGAGTANSSGTYQAGDRGGGLILRGLGTTTFERDGFMQIGAYSNPGSTGNGYTTNFDFERVEVVNGPQALLYGGGGAGGVVDLVSKQARLGKPSFGSFQFQVNQYGGKMGQLDFGTGNDTVAVRVALLDQSTAYSRIFVGGDLDGAYTQIAYAPFKNTTIRVTVQQTTYNRINNNNSRRLTLSAASTSNESRNSEYVAYLLASNQIGAAANGAPSGAGPIDNGNVNWGNVDSYAAWWSSELTVDEFALLNAETRWTSWLSTKLDLGYNDYEDDWPHPGVTLNAPNKSTNPLGVWALSTTPVVADEPGRSKAIRFSALATNDLFGGSVHSQTILGVDFTRHVDQSQKVNYTWYQADSNWNIIVNPSVSANDGRTPIGTLYWPISNGPVKYPLFAPSSQRIVVNGTNYVEAIQNEINPAFISPSNPLGVTAGSADDYSNTLTINRGIYGVNYTNWLGGKLDTIVGFRLGKYYDIVQGPGAFLGVPNAAPIVTGAVSTQIGDVYGFNVGADYAVRPWLHPYFSASDSYNPPNTLSTDFLGNVTPISKALGEELGVKFNNASNTLSGSIALYHVSAQNNEFQVSTTFQNDINPSGLNGVYSAPSTYVFVDQISEGVQGILTASPTSNWRLRLSAAAVNGKINTGTSYGQLYNDQFYENSSGQVTYADGTVVYVPPTFNSKQLTVPSTTAGAIPLTATLLSTPSGQYFAAPLQVNGQISATSNGGLVLAGGASSPNGTTGHGNILTGKTGLPISQNQLNLPLAGVTVPGTIITSQAGQPTTGYPEYSLSGTSVYTIASGFAKGFEVGGTETLGWKNRDYLYYPAGFSLAANEVMFNGPVISRTDLIFGYSRKFGRVTLRSQVNITNAFNHYSILILPNPLTGFVSNPNAVFSQQPRAYVWTNTLSF